MESHGLRMAALHHAHTANKGRTGRHLRTGHKAPLHKTPSGEDSSASSLAQAALARALSRPLSGMAHRVQVTGRHRDTHRNNTAATRAAIRHSSRTAKCRATHLNSLRTTLNNSRRSRSQKNTDLELVLALCLVLAQVWWAGRS